MANLSDKIGPSGVATGDQGVATTDSPTFSGGTVTGTLNAATFNATSTTNGGFQGIDADTATTPSFTWTADLNTGIYRPAADTLSVTTAGSQRFTVGPAGQIGVGGANYGTSGQVLTSNGTGSAPSWATVSAGWEYISTATASNSASITFSGLNFDAYEYAIQCYNLRPATDESRLYFYNSSNGSTFYQATYTNMYGSTIWGAGLTGNLDNVAGNETQFCMELQEIDNRLVTQTVGHLMDQYGGSHFSFMSATTVNSNSYTNTVAVRFAMSAGNIATGTFKLNRQPRKPYS